MMPTMGFRDCGWVVLGVSVLAACRFSAQGIPGPDVGGDVGPARPESAPADRRIVGEGGVARCGDGVAEGTETCDGTDLRGQSCASLGLGGGTLTCAPACRFDLAGCTSCGDGKLQGLEERDGSELNGKTCVSLGFGSGSLGCAGCRLDTTSCVASTAGHATAVYGTSSELAVRRRDSGGWSPKVIVPGTIGSPRWIVSRISPVFDSSKQEVAVALAATASDLRLHFIHFGSSGWVCDDVITLPVPTLDADKRVFDLVYEASSGRALAVYSDNTANPSYRIFSAGSWSAPQKAFATPPGKAPVRWVTLASRPGANEIALAYSDAATMVMAALWNGTSFVESSRGTLAGPTLHVYQSFDVAYEQKSGEPLVVTGETCCSCFGYARKSTTGGVFWEGSTSGSFCGSGGSTWIFQRLASQRGTNLIALAADKWTVGTWGGQGWTSLETLWNGPSGIDERRWADVAWVGAQPVAIAVQRGWTDGTSTAGRGKLFWSRYASSSWQRGAAAAVAGLGELTWAQLVPAPTADQVLALFSDDNRNLYSAAYEEGKGWAVENSGAALAAKELSTSMTRPFSLDVWQK